MVFWLAGRGRVVRKQQAATWQAVEVATDPATPLYEPTWIHPLLLYGQQQTRANWAAVLDRSRGNPPGGKATVARLPLQDKAGRELAPGLGAAVAVTAPDGRWIVAYSRTQRHRCRGLDRSRTAG